MTPQTGRALLALPTTMAAKTEELRAWASKARENGIIDVKFFPGKSVEASADRAAEAALALLVGNAYEEELTDETI